jgi:PAS domain S-box-containing protein
MQNTAGYFDAFFTNTRQNAILIMSTDGIIREVNQAFTTAYGYDTEDLQSKQHRVLFTEKDQVKLLPEIELNKTNREGSSSDENYIVHKDGSLVWVTGESVLIKTQSETCIVKVIHNIHAQKQLERYLLASNELLDSLFHSVKTGLLLLDSRMRTIKCNQPFLKLFHLEAPIPEGSKIQEIAHPFWADEELKNDIRNALIKGERINKEYIFGNSPQEFRRIHVSSKVLAGEEHTERKVLLVVHDA